MPLTLEQYATTYLDGRGLPWPAAPVPDPPRARPHLKRLPVKVVFWNVYGTLLAVPQGELLFEHPLDFVMDSALEKTIHEFKMWNSMVRKPGAPAAYMKDLYQRALAPLRVLGGEVASEQVWDNIVKKLLQKGYQIDVGVYGALNEFVQKVAYFFHASIQGVGPYPGAAAAVRAVADSGRLQGLLADGQVFTPAQVTKGLRQEDPGFEAGMYFPANLTILSAEKKARKPAAALFQAAADALAARGLAPADALHVGSSVLRDLAPAKRAGMRTALFAGDKNSLAATPEQLKDPALRPDVMLTELPQIADVLG